MKPQIFFVGIIGLLVFACEAPFDAELDTAEPRLVIEAWLTDVDKPAGIVRLTRSQAYFDTSALEKVTGALVLMTDLNTGQIDTLRTSENPDNQHIYRAKDITPTPGHRYRLEVYESGQYYHAEADMLPMTAIDSLTTSVMTRTNQTLPEFFIWWNGQEPPEANQFYYTNRRKISGRKLKQRFKYDDIYSDAFVNGRYLRFDIYSINRNYEGDTIVVDAGTMNPVVHDHFLFAEELQSGFGDPFDPIPTNPPTNIEGGALGYFHATSVYRDTIIVRFED